MLNYRCSLPHLPHCPPSPTNYNWCEANSNTLEWEARKLSRCDAWPQFKGRRSSEGGTPEKKSPCGILVSRMLKALLNASLRHLMRIRVFHFLYAPPTLPSSGAGTNQFDVLPLFYVLFVLGKRCSHISFDWKLHSPNQLNEDFLISYFLLRTFPAT